MPSFTIEWHRFHPHQLTFLLYFECFRRRSKCLFQLKIIKIPIKSHKNEIESATVLARFSVSTKYHFDKKKIQIKNAVKLPLATQHSITHHIHRTCTQCVYNTKFTEEEDEKKTRKLKSKVKIGVLLDSHTDRAPPFATDEIIFFLADMDAHGRSFAFFVYVPCRYFVVALSFVSFLFRLYNFLWRK